MGSKNAKKKLKKLRALGGNPQTPASSSNIGQMMNSLQSLKVLKTVNAGDDAQPLNPNPIPTPNVHLPANVEVPHEDEEDGEEEWSDEEDGNDGGSVSAVPQAAPETSLPVAETPAVEIAQPIIETPQSEHDYSAAAAALQNASPFAPETANRNIETQPEETQESNMNVVNHPALVQNAQPAPLISADHGGLVPESAMEQMQSTAVAQPPAAATTAAPQSTEQVEKKKPQAAFHNIQITKMFTLDLTNFDFMMGLKNSLSRVNFGGEELNLYSPFRKGGKRTEAKPAAEGILRHVLSPLLDLSDAVNNSRVMVVGKAEEVQSHIQNAIDITKTQMLNLFPTKPEAIVASYIDEEQDATIELQFGDIVNVRSWTNSSAANTDEENIPFEIHNAVINTTVNAGMLYDAEDRVKEIHRVIKSIELMVSKREGASTTIVMSIALDASLLADASIREMLDTLITEENFAVYSRQELLRLDENDFLPQSREEVEQQLMVPKADLLLMRIITQEEEDEEEEDAGTGDDVPAADVADEE